MTEEQVGRGAILDLVLIHGHDDEDCGAQGQLTTEWWHSRFLGLGGSAQQAHSLDFRREALCLFGVCLVEYNGLKPCKEEGSKESGYYSRITFSKLRSDEFQQRGRKAKRLRSLHGLTRSSWTNINTKRMSTVEGRTSSLGGIQRGSVNHQGSG